LNPNVKVKKIDSLAPQDYANYKVVCVTEIFENIDKMIEANEICRKAGNGFILASTFGPCGYTFVDYSDNFIINDPNGEDTKAFIVVNVS